MFKDMITTKEKIIKEGKRLFAQKGYDETSMAEVAKASGIEKASLYYFFESKESLLTEILQSIWRKIVDDIEEINKNRAEYKSNREHLSAIIQYFLNNYMEGGVILGKSGELCKNHSAVFKRIFKYISQLEKTMKERLKEYGAEDPKIARELITNACGAYIMKKQHFKNMSGTKKYADYLSSIIVKN